MSTVGAGHTAAPSSTLPASVSHRWPGLPCQTVDPDLWFSVMPEGVEEAKRLCRGCPVRLSCLALALGRAEPWGVWGGELLVHGQIRPYKRGPGRPRKEATAA